MASIEQRRRKDGSTAYRVKFRLGGTRAGAQQTETFDTLKVARRFQAEVDACDQQWPHGWVPGLGRDTAPAATDPPAPPAPEASAGPPLKEWGEQYIRDLTAVSPDSRERYKRQLARLDTELAEIIGEPVTMLNVTTVHIRRWVNAREQAGVAPKTVANYHGLLAGMFNEARALGLRDDNPCERVRLPRRDAVSEDTLHRPRRDLSWQEFALLADAMYAPDDPDCVGRPGDRRFLEVLVGTGLRFSEVTALTVGDLDLDAAVPTLRVAKAHKRNACRTSEFHLPGRAGTYVGPPKTRRSVREVVLTPALVEILREQAGSRRPEARLFTAPRGGQIYNGTFTEDRWQPAVRLARQRGLTKTPRLHDLRHTHSAWCSSAGVPVEEIQNRHGHESITTTIGVYGGRTNRAWDNLPAAIDPGLRPAG